MFGLAHPLGTQAIPGNRAWRTVGANAPADFGPCIFMKTEKLTIMRAFTDNGYKVSAGLVAPKSVKKVASYSHELPTEVRRRSNQRLRQPPPP